MALFRTSRTRTSEPLNWAALPPRQVTGKKGRIVNPLMEECAKLCTDETRQRIFSRAARGTLPRWFALRETRLSVKIKKKISAITLSTNPREAMEQMMNFIEQYDNVYSESDNVRPSEEALEKAFGNNISHRKNFQLTMLDIFMKEKAHEYKLTQGQYEKSFYTLHAGFALNHFRCKDVRSDPETQKITSVVGFVYSKKKGFFVIHPDVFKRCPAKKKAPTKKINKNKELTASNFFLHAAERQKTEPVQYEEQDSESD